MTPFDLPKDFDEFTKRQDSLLSHFRTLESSAYLCGIYVLYISKSKPNHPHVINLINY